MSNFFLSVTSLKELKNAIRALYPVSSGHLSEGLAFSLGFNTHAALLTEINTKDYLPRSFPIDDAKFLSRLRDLDVRLGSWPGLSAFIDDTSERKSAVNGEKIPSHVHSMMQAADWRDLKMLPATRDTNFWFYSVSAIHGPRFMFNVTRPLLDDARSMSGSISKIRMTMNPLNAYTTAISAFDKEKNLSEKMALGEPMALAMTAYAIDQKSWRSLISDQTSDDKHVLVLDWETQAGPRCCQAGFKTPSGLLPDKEALIALSMALYEKSYGVKPKTF